MRKARTSGGPGLSLVLYLSLSDQMEAHYAQLDIVLSVS